MIPQLTKKKIKLYCPYRSETLGENISLFYNNVEGPPPDNIKDRAIFYNKLYDEVLLYINNQFRAKPISLRAFFINEAFLSCRWLMELMEQDSFLTRQVMTLHEKWTNSSCDNSHELKSEHDKSDQAVDEDEILLISGESSVIPQGFVSGEGVDEVNTNDDDDDEKSERRHDAPLSSSKSADSKRRRKKYRTKGRKSWGSRKLALDDLKKTFHNIENLRNELYSLLFHPAFHSNNMIPVRILRLSSDTSTWSLWQSNIFRHTMQIHGLMDPTNSNTNSEEHSSSPFTSFLTPQHQSYHSVADSIVCIYDKSRDEKYDSPIDTIPLDRVVKVHQKSLLNDISYIIFQRRHGPLTLPSSLLEDKTNGVKRLASTPKILSSSSSRSEVNEAKTEESEVKDHPFRKKKSSLPTNEVVEDKKNKISRRASSIRKLMRKKSSPIMSTDHLQEGMTELELFNTRNNRGSLKAITRAQSLPQLSLIPSSITTQEEPQEEGVKKTLKLINEEEEEEGESRPSSSQQQHKMQLSNPSASRVGHSQIAASVATLTRTQRRGSLSLQVLGNFMESASTSNTLAPIPPPKEKKNSQKTNGTITPTTTTVRCMEDPSKFSSLPREDSSDGDSGDGEKSKKSKKKSLSKKLSVNLKNPKSKHKSKDK